MIRVLLFGAVADRIGQRQLSLPAGEGISLLQLLEQLDCASMQPVLLAVNQQQVNDTTIIIHKGDEVAIMPPFSGG